MNEVTINGKTYPVPEMSFDAICQLEEAGVNLLNTDKKNPKIATMLRGLVAWIMDVEPSVASAEIQAHIESGGNIMEILDAVTGALQSSSFFNAGRGNNVTQVKGNRQASTARKSTSPSRK